MLLKRCVNQRLRTNHSNNKIIVLQDRSNWRIHDCGQCL